MKDKKIIAISGIAYIGLSLACMLAINNKVYITTKGYGHGVGLSQYGANEMAKSGYTYDEILKYYYKNIDINNA